MRRHPLLAALIAALAAFAACRASDPVAPAAEPAPAASSPSIEALEPAPCAPRLALRAFALSTRGKAAEARRLIASEIAGSLRGAGADPEAGLAPSDADPVPAEASALRAADLVVAALHGWQLASERERWTETVAWIEALRPFPAAVPPELAAVLDARLAEGLVHLGRVDEARAVTRGLGYVTAWNVIGPFDNERGKGYAKKEAPEEALQGPLDFDARAKGKAREVAWRPNPLGDHPLGRVDLGELFRPSTQGFAYLATAVRSEAGEECVLRLASRGALKVFVNGREVLARKVSRPLSIDQDRVAIALAAGWNRILVKSCIEEEGEWVLEARLTALDGRPVSLEVDPARAADAPPAARKPDGKPAREAREVLEGLAAKDPDAARLATLYHLLVHPDDRAAKSARKAIEKALAQGADADTLYLQALAHEPDAETSREELEVNPWIAPLKQVIALDPGHVAARLDLADFALELNPTPARADRESAAALAAAPADPRALATRVRALQRIERPGEAALLQKELVHCPEHAWTDVAVAARAREHLLHGRRAAALEVLRGARAHEARPSESLDFLLELLADEGGAHAIEEAARVAEQAALCAPDDGSFLRRAAHVLEVAGADEIARVFLDRALQLAPEDVDVQRALARLDQRAGKMEAADARLAEILRIDPAQDKLRRQREYLARGGAETGAERFDAAYAWDARKKLAEAPRAADADQPLTVVDRTTAYLVNRDGTWSGYEHILWRIENEGGVKALDSYALFHPRDGALAVRALRVLHADGSADPVPPPRRGDVATGGGFARVYDLPPLRVGDAVDVEYTIEQGEPSVFGNYFGLRHEFYPGRPDPFAPTLRAELVLVHGKDVELHFQTRNAEDLEVADSVDAEGRVVNRWVARSLPRPEPETAMPPRSEFAPIVDASTYASWEAFAAWWWSFIEKEFQTSQAMRDKVAELTRDAATEEEKVRAIVRFVGQEIRYNSWPFGTHGYEPFSAPVIFERRFGDCKDKSILLCQLLAEIGVHAHPVLIKAQYRQPDDPLELAMVEHFNHCIAFVPAAGENPGRYLDCTADLNPVEYLRADDQGARVLHVDQGQGSLHDIPYAPPAENQLVRRYEVALDADGNGEVRLVDESNGMFGVGLRTNYGGEKGDLEKRLSRELRDTFSQVEVLEVETGEMEDLGVPPRLAARFAAKNLWARETGGAGLRLAFDRLGLEGLAVEPRDRRKHPIVLDRPFAHAVTIAYRLPAGVKVASVPPAIEVVAPGLLAYRQEVRAEGGVVEVERRFELLERRVGHADYAAFQDALRKVELAEQRTVRLEIEGGGR